MRRSIVKEYSEAMRGRYGKASRAEKGQLLDEFTKMTGYHRKSAIRLLGGRGRPESGRKNLGRPRSYDGEMVGALKQVWEAADRICGKRLAPFMGELVDKAASVGGALSEAGGG